MTNKSLVALYEEEIAEIKVKMQKMQTRQIRFYAESYKSCDKYPSFMHEELHEKYMNSYKNEVKQLESLILELI